VKLKLIDKKPEVPNVYSFIWQPDQPVSWEAGQYLHYILPHPQEDDRGTARWFTISAAPFEKHIRLTTRFDTQRSSTFKQALQKLPIGDEIESDDGPKGTFVIQPNASRYYFIAGGIGITPFRSILAQLDHDNKPFNIELLYANRDQDLVFGDELRELEMKHRDFHIHTFLDGQRIDETALKMCSEDDKCIFYLSGPRPMVENYEHLLKDLGVAEERIKLDYFPGYN